MQVSASDHCERTILFTVSILAKVQINEECLLRNVESWESWTLADTANLVSRRFLVADAVVWRLPGILALPGNTLPVPVQGKNEQSIEQLYPGRTNTCPSSMSCKYFELTRHSCSNPLHIDHNGHKCRCQPVTSFHQWSVPPSHCWKLKQGKFSRHLKPCFRKLGRVLVVDAAAWQASAKPLMAINAVDLDMSCFLPSSCPMRQQFANKCNDTVVSRLPSQMSSAVALTKFLSDWCEGLIHPSSFAKELPVLFATTERLNIFPNSRFITFI